MNQARESDLSDLAKALLDIDKIEYQRSQQEINLRLQMRSTLLTVVLTVAGFGAFVLGPALAFLLSQDPLFALAVILGVMTGMCYFSIILYYEMLNQGHYIAISASYMHNVIRQRIRQRLVQPAEINPNSIGPRPYGVLDWEHFLFDRVGARWPVGKGGFVRRWLAFLFRFDQWLRGEVIPLFIAVVSWGTAVVLVVSNSDALWTCHFAKAAGCILTATKNVSMYQSVLVLTYILILLLVLAVPMFIVGIVASKKVNAQFREISSSTGDVATAALPPPP